TRRPSILRRPVHHVEREPTIPKGRDNQPAGGQRRIRLAVAGRAQRDRSVQIEIGATLGALDDMVDLEPAASAAGLAAPPGAAPLLGADDLPLLGGRALAPMRPRLIGSASPPRRPLEWFTPNQWMSLPLDLPTWAKMAPRPPSRCPRGQNRSRCQRGQ